jgi:hypothetical protein
MRSRDRDFLRRLSLGLGIQRTCHDRIPQRIDQVVLLLHYLASFVALVIPQVGKQLRARVEDLERAVAQLLIQPQDPGFHAVIRMLQFQPEPQIFRHQIPAVELVTRIREGIDDAADPIARSLNVVRVHVRRLPAALVFPVGIGDAILPSECEPHTRCRFPADVHAVTSGKVRRELELLAGALSQ